MLKQSYLSNENKDNYTAVLNHSPDFQLSPCQRQHGFDFASGEAHSAWCLETLTNCKIPSIARLYRSQSLDILSKLQLERQQNNTDSKNASESHSIFSTTMTWILLISPLGHKTPICNGKHDLNLTRLPARIKLTKNIVLNGEFQLWKISTHPSKTAMQKKNSVIRVDASNLFV